MRERGSGIEPVIGFAGEGEKNSKWAAKRFDGKKRPASESIPEPVLNVRGYVTEQQRADLAALEAQRTRLAAIKDQDSKRQARVDAVKKRSENPGFINRWLKKIFGG